MTKQVELLDMDLKLSTKHKKVLFRGEQNVLPIQDISQISHPLVFSIRLR